MDTDSWSGKHPDLWSRHDVKQWLQWCMAEYALSDINLERFNMNGKALCMLTKDNFCDRVPEVGDVLYNTLVKLLGDFHEEHHHLRQVPMDLRHTPIPMTVTSYQCTCDDSQSDNKYGVQSHGRHGCRRQSEDMFVPLPRSRSGYPYEGPDPFRSTEDIKPLDLTLTTMAAAKEEDEDHDRFPTPPHSACELPDMSAPSEQRGSTFGSLITHTAEEREEEEEEQEEKEEEKWQRAYSAAGADDRPDLSRLSPETPPPVPFGVMNVIGNTGQIFSILNDPIQLETVSTTNSDCRLLWEFLHELLKDSKYARLVRWENESKYMFRICSPNGLARLWGRQKNRANMTYEKLARALRYYYKVHIITKVPGKRLTYRFLVPPDEIRKGVRGAKPGVPHVRRQRQRNESETMSDACHHTQSTLGAHSETGSDVISATSMTTNCGQQPMEGLEIRTSGHDSTRENTCTSLGRMLSENPKAHSPRWREVVPIPPATDCAQAIRQASAVVNDSISPTMNQSETVCYESRPNYQQLTTYDECTDSCSPKHDYNNNSNNHSTSIESNDAEINNSNNTSVDVTTFMPLIVVPTTETGELDGK